MNSTNRYSLCKANKDPGSSLEVYTCMKELNHKNLILIVYKTYYVNMNERSKIVVTIINYMRKSVKHNMNFILVWDIEIGDPCHECVYSIDIGQRAEHTYIHR